MKSYGSRRVVVLSAMVCALVASVSGVQAQDQETAINPIADPRLTVAVGLKLKFKSFTDLCNELRTRTGVAISASPGVADDNVTVLCKPRSLASVLQRVEDLFGFTWVRTGAVRDYRYELTQTESSLRREAALRQRTLRAAQFALDREAEEYRKLIALTDEERRDLGSRADPQTRTRLESLGYGADTAVMVYHNLSQVQKDQIFAGNKVALHSHPSRGESPIPDGAMAGIDKRMSRIYVNQQPDRTEVHYSVPVGVPSPAGQPLNTLVGAGARIVMSANEGELGDVSLIAATTWHADVLRMPQVSMSGITARAEDVEHPENAKHNAALKGVSTFTHQVAWVVQPSCKTVAKHRGPLVNPASTRADVLEAIHLATGADVIGDSFARFFAPPDLSVSGQNLFESLCSVGDHMRMRWSRADGWLTFRTTTYFFERLADVPNRLLERWSAARVSKKTLQVQEMLEVAALSDRQLSNRREAERAMGCYGLQEWSELRDPEVRPHWRLAAGFPAAARARLCSSNGLMVATLPREHQTRVMSVLQAEGGDPSLNSRTLAAVRIRLLLPEPIAPEATPRKRGTKKARTDITFLYTFDESTKTAWTLERGENHKSTSRE